MIPLRLSIPVFLLAAIAVSATAGEDLNGVMARVSAASLAVQDAGADVLQTKYFADMDEETVFRGNLLYKRPGRMRWEFSDPDRSILLILPDGVWLMVPDIKQAQGFLGPERKRIDAFLLGFERSPEDLLGEYQIRLGGVETGEEGPLQRVDLTGGDNPHARQISVWYDQNHLPRRLRWTSVQGDWTQTEFENLIINQGMPDEPFVLDIPEDYEVVTQ